MFTSTTEKPTGLDMSLSPNNTAPRIVTLANPCGDRRMRLFQTALENLGLPPAVLIPYEDYLDGKTRLTEILRPGDIFRIDSPGRNFAVERTLLRRGAQVTEEEDTEYFRLTPGQVDALEFDKGLILPSRQWYLGYTAVLRELRDEINEIPNLRLMTPPDEIAEMFDKRHCQQCMHAAGIRVPPALHPIQNFDHLLSEMNYQGISRVFIKLAHGSSAAGTVAFQKAGHGLGAITRGEIINENGRVKLYATRRIRTLYDPQEIQILVDTLCRHRVHVERWLPKASHENGVFDLRVVTIAGQAEHVVVRTSRSPMTNLHLLNQRGDWPSVRARLGPDTWVKAQRLCLAAKALFPKSLYAGVDLLVSPDYRSIAVLEINAFGDLLPGITHQGQDTYMKEIAAAIESTPSP